MCLIVARKRWSLRKIESLEDDLFCQKQLQNNVDLYCMMSVICRSFRSVIFFVQYIWMHGKKMSLLPVKRTRWPCAKQVCVIASKPIRTHNQLCKSVYLQNSIIPRNDQSIFTLKRLQPKSDDRTEYCQKRSPFSFGSLSCMRVKKKAADKV